MYVFAVTDSVKIFFTTVTITTVGATPLFDNNRYDYVKKWKIENCWYEQTNVEWVSE